MPGQVSQIGLVPVKDGWNGLHTSIVPTMYLLLEEQGGSFTERSGSIGALVMPTGFVIVVEHGSGFNTW